MVRQKQGLGQSNVFLFRFLNYARPPDMLTLLLFRIAHPPEMPDQIAFALVILGLPPFWALETVVDLAISDICCDAANAVLLGRLPDACCSSLSVMGPPYILFISVRCNYRSVLFRASERLEFEFEFI